MTKMIAVGKEKTSKYNMKCTSSASLHNISEDMVPVQVPCVFIFLKQSKAATQETSFSLLTLQISLSSSY